IFDFVLREMTSPDGAFYTAFDAEVDAQEGLSYLWTLPEVEAILGPEDGKLFAQVYGLDRGPNFADPHHGTGRPDKNISYLRAAEYLLRHHLREGVLYRTSRDGSEPKYRGFLDDYAFLIQALLALQAATGVQHWRAQASALASLMRDQFGDDRAGGLFFTDAK